MPPIIWKKCSLQMHHELDIVKEEGKAKEVMEK